MILMGYMIAFFKQAYRIMASMVVIVLEYQRLAEQPAFEHAIDEQKNIFPLRGRLHDPQGVATRKLWLHAGSRQLGSLLHSIT